MTRNHKPPEIDKSIKYLDEFQECEGILQEILENETAVVLIFLTKTKIGLPSDNQVMGFLKKHVGKEIAILRTDDKNIPYVVKDAEEVKE